MRRGSRVIRVPTAAVRPLLESWLSRQDDGSLSSLALRSGVPIRTIYAIRYDERAWAELHTVDCLLVAMGRPDYWHVELADYYEDVA